VQQQRVVLQPAETAVRAHKTLEGMHPPGVIDAGDQDHVAAVRQGAEPQQVPCRTGTVRGERVLSVNGVIAQPVQALGTDGHRPVLRGSDHRDPNGRAGHQPGDQSRPVAIELGQVGTVGQVREPRHAEVARGDDGQLWKIRTHGGAGQRPVRTQDDSAPATRDVAQRGGEQRVHRAPLLTRAGLHRVLRSGVHQHADQLGEAAPLLLLEGRAQALPMIGHDDHAVAAGRDTLDLLEQTQHVVQTLQGTQGLGAFGPGVMGDLVVVDEIHEDRRRGPEHVLGHQGDIQVAQHGVGDAAQDDVGTPPGHPRHDPTHPLPVTLVELLDHLGDAEQHGAGEHERTAEEADVGLCRAQSATLGNPAHDKQGHIGVAGEHGAHGDPAAGQQTVTRADPGLDKRGVGRPVGHDEPLELAVPPPEGNHLVVVAMQQPGLAGRRG